MISARFLPLALGLVFSGATPLFGAEPPAPALSAGELASRLSTKQQDGNSYVRLRMEAKDTVLQLQLKSRQGRGSTELVYQILWPKERKGEAVLLKKAGGHAATVTLFTPPDKARELDPGQLREAFFGSDLSYEDVAENFFSWDQQAFTGSETVDRVPCQVLESKPGKGEHSSYASVKSWIDLRRMVPLRVEKYGAGGKLVRRIETTRVVSDDKGRPIPANLTVQSPGGGAGTQLDGSKIKHGVEFTDDEFTAAGLKKAPGAAE